MHELAGIKRQSSPPKFLLVADAMTGQEATNVAKGFNDRLGITGVIFTKLDGDTRGGAALSIHNATGAPIKFVGVGEKLQRSSRSIPNASLRAFSGWATRLR